MTPNVSYTIWFSQRNGSTLLCEALKNTNIAGKPRELLELPGKTSLLEYYKVKDSSSLQRKLWAEGMTDNGVFGLKANAPRKDGDPIIDALAQIEGNDTLKSTPYTIWENAFPNGKHIFLTRRNKVRQVVSWWKAIVTEQWHLIKGEEGKLMDPTLSDKYNFEALKYLLLEVTFREARIQAFLDGGRSVPLTIVYEDFILEYEKTISRVIDFLGIPNTNYHIKEPYYEQLSDGLSDEWTERFRKELQKDWSKIIW